jgi:hypothetical protein
MYLKLATLFFFFVIKSKRFILSKASNCKCKNLKISDLAHVLGLESILVAPATAVSEFKAGFLGWVVVPPANVNSYFFGHALSEKYRILFRNFKKAI